MSNKKNENKVGRQNLRSAFSIQGMSGCLPARLQKRQEFLSVAAANKKFVTSGFILQCGAPFNEDSQSLNKASKLRIGYTASRRVGGAVERNRVKRKLKELTRLVLAPKLKSGRDYVLVGRKAAIKRPLELLVKDAEKLLAKM